MRCGERGNSSSGFGNPRSTAQCNEHKHHLHSCLMPFCAGSNNRPVEWVPVWLSRFETFDAGPTTCSRPSQASIHTAKAQHASTPHAGCRSLALSACFARGVRHHQSRCLSAVRPAPSPARLCPPAVRGCLTFPLEDFPEGLSCTLFFLRHWGPVKCPGLLAPHLLWGFEGMSKRMALSLTLSQELRFCISVACCSHQRPGDDPESWSRAQIIEVAWA